MEPEFPTNLEGFKNLPGFDPIAVAAMIYLQKLVCIVKKRCLSKRENFKEAIVFKLHCSVA
jgi:hypothetical protein